MALYNYLPDVIKIAEHAWGFALLSLNSLFYVFSAFLALVLLFSVLQSVAAPKAPFFKGGLLFSGVLLLVASILSWYAVSVAGASTLLGSVGSLLFAVALASFMGTVLAFTHAAYDVTC